MAQIVRLDLTHVPIFVGTPLFCCIDSDTEEALKPLTDTFARVRCACRFLQRFGGSTDFLNVHEEELSSMWAGYLRAALMEYAGMEDSCRADMRRLGLRKRAPSIDDTQNAMLILLRELRNLHVHVVQRRFDIASRNVVLRTRDEDRDSASARALGHERNSEIDIITIPRVDLYQVLSARASRRFDTVELATAIEWLDEAQCRWGIRDVLLAALDDYSEIILRAIA